MAHDEVKAFLEEILSFEATDHPTRVRVTLTFAQSIDAKIAGQGGKQLILSCKESMVMTHCLYANQLILTERTSLRSKHDAILVGIGTALNDDPQLNTRLLPPNDGGREIPLPVILDKNLRFRLDSKLVKNYKEQKGKQPIIFTADMSRVDHEWTMRRGRLEDEGISVIPIPMQDGKLSLSALLISLRKFGVHSLMVEGGASIISSFLQSGLVDRLIVTVCPTIVGEAGVVYNVKEEYAPQLQFINSHRVGSDTVMAWKAATATF